MKDNIIQLRTINNTYDGYILDMTKGNIHMGYIVSKEDCTLCFKKGNSVMVNGLKLEENQPDFLMVFSTEKDIDVLIEQATRAKYAFREALDHKEEQK